MLFFGPFILSLSYVLPIEIKLGSGLIKSSVEAFEVVPYPYFSSEPNATNLGLSNQFTWEHHISTGGNDYNYVNLTWNHVANTTLDYATDSATSQGPPDCNEFIYISQSIYWPYENQPLQQILRIDYAIDVSGDFSLSGTAANMYQVYVWLIDSSENWRRIHQSNQPYDEGFVSEEESMIIHSNSEIWGGMVEDESGVQEDPEDRVDVVVGLAPTTYFLQYGSIEPWRQYNGEVTLTLRKLSLEVLLGREGSKYEILPTVYNNTYTLSDVSNCDGLELGNDGNVYTLGNMGFGINETPRSSLVLTKWDSLTNLVWTIKWNSTHSTWGSDISFHNGFIYVVGWSWDNNNDPPRLFISKWDTSGNQIWEQKIDEYVGEKIAIESNGSIYVMSGKLQFITRWYIDPLGNNITYTDLEYKPSLIKFNSDGELIWTRTWETWDPSSCYGWCLEISSSGDVFTFDGYNFTKWNDEGTMVWNELRGWWWNIEVINGEYAFNFDHLRGIFKITKYNISEGSPHLQFDWDDFYNTTYGSWFPNFGYFTTSSSPDDYAYIMWEESRDILYNYNQDDRDVIISKYDLTGNKIWNHSLELGNNDWIKYMKIANDGVIYCAGTDRRGSIILRIYYDPDRNVPLIPEYVAIALYATASILIILVVADYIRRKRR